MLNSSFSHCLRVSDVYSIYLFCNTYLETIRAGNQLLGKGRVVAEKQKSRGKVSISTRTEASLRNKIKRKYFIRKDRIHNAFKINLAMELQWVHSKLKCEHSHGPSHCTEATLFHKVVFSPTLWARPLSTHRIPWAHWGDPRHHLKKVDTASCRVSWEVVGNEPIGQTEHTQTQKGLFDTGA